MGRHESIALKVDITKAFDTISWNFLYQVLRRMNFSDQFTTMISNILHSARLSILINGTPHSYFSCSRDVCQGDPLSPLIYCLAEEALIRLINYRVDTSILTTHMWLMNLLMYADDIFIVLEATKDNCRNIRDILVNYRNISG